MAQARPDPDQDPFVAVVEKPCASFAVRTDWTEVVAGIAAVPGRQDHEDCTATTAEGRADEQTIFECFRGCQTERG